ncbi:hypothetical protein EVAR_14565_1 [Eumeta japonica]|uniref:Uncharacterized protein n=1 Tax=Eumeta variegata TaxID=151549 RepID=A0A4C1UUD4_EUMVA|nr:hypothetical protein EVAR_14565_1 [Eumeta japonica]
MEDKPLRGTREMCTRCAESGFHSDWPCAVRFAHGLEWNFYLKANPVGGRRPRSRISGGSRRGLTEGEIGNVERNGVPEVEWITGPHTQWKKGSNKTITSRV